jgi:toxin ParE1/3/4
VELRWTSAAIEDLDQAGAFIEADNPRAASAMAGRVQEAVETLVRYPNLGRAGRVRSTRELVVSGTPFVVVYRVRIDEVQVLRVLHHARRFLPPAVSFVRVEPVDVALEPLIYRHGRLPAQESLRFVHRGKGERDVSGLLREPL